ncbi:unnamed protein product [Tilletia controversa]|uniref:Major facilitator superfamily (MFS) profile domain-containing protein n=3 Tax=Tilletia TaxID=13289 RepID=A0A8X7N0P4_9BASI|nr:hypothetical protein CF336_g1804 [Tilletia laevis]KAE8204996.1 hypothetical protein CF328_g748 [Tilletia controversa]KAE8263932.1 hypothetical protein A4X03_0g1317 [Tilletia caries]KAE8207436.1 hypothetical protein CF335_g1142 [Tilletia laevis]KAE8254547.1 hypothetical protein A4X06_0g843 [Tilletia controversa]
MSDPLRSPSFTSSSPSRTTAATQSASPSPLRHQTQQQSQAAPSAHIRFEDELLHPPPSASSASASPSSQTVDLPTGPLIDFGDSPDDDNENSHRPHSPVPSPILQGGTSPNNQNKKMSVMREQRNYGATLSASNLGTGSRPSSRDRSPSGAAGPSSSAADAGARSYGPGRIEMPSSSLDAGYQSAAGGSAGGKQRAFSFKKRAPSIGASSAASGAQRRMSAARKLLNRASLGFFGNAPDLDAQSASSRAGTPVTPFSAAAGAGPGAGARNRWKNLRRTQTLSVHQQNEGVLSPLNPDAYDDGYGYGHNDDDKPRIPQMLPTTKPDPDSTPIPTLPFFVLCVMIFGEFSSAGVAGPFLFFMIGEFDVGGEAEVGFWAGIVSAVFFFAQFLTSMLWASVANKHGRKVVLLVSLLGNCATLILFGTSKNLKTAILVRLTQGLFNGAVGVAKGAVRDLTDPTNEARAYGIMGFCWGMGGIIGPILGGVLEHPVEKFPAIFGKSKLFAEYPYLLPCLLTASTTGLGAILTLFLGRDGGPRSGTINLPEKDTERAAATVQTRVVRTAAANVESFGRNAGKRISGYFSTRSGVAGPSGTSGGAGGAGDESAGESQDESNISLETTARGKNFMRTFTQQRDWDTGGPPSPAASDVTIVTRTNAPMDSGFDDRSIVSRAFSRTSARRQSVVAGSGSAYGHNRRPSRSSQLASHPGRLGSAFARRDPSAGPSVMQSGFRERASVYAPDFEEELGGASGLSFAQRFLLANDDAVLSLTDLWVAAAIGEDGVNALDENVFLDDEDEDYEEGDGEGEDTFDDDGTASIGTDDEAIMSDDDENIGGTSGVGSSGRRAFNALNQPSEDSPLLARRPLVPAHFAHRKLSQAAKSDAASSAFSSGTRGRARGRGLGPSRRRGRSGSASTATGGGGGRPLLFVHAGVEIPHGMHSPRSPAPQDNQVSSGGGYFPSASAGEQQSGAGGASSSGAANFNSALAGIPEGYSVRNSLHAGGQSHTPQLSTLQEGAATSAFTTRTGPLASAISGGGPSASQSVWALLPLAIVAQYGVMSWHSSTFDQVFMAFLVTDVKSGGLGLTAAHFAELIAAMAVCQMVFQFQVYPTVGPPRGKCTHLTMFRMGLALYLPVYTLFPFLRNFLSSTDATVMSGMIFFASLRWLANVTAFTAVTVLMNAMTPPHLIPLTNGLAQTVSSFMRCVGPIVGGLVWAKSIEGGPDANGWPFNYHLGFWVVGLVAFAGFLHSLTIR